MQCVSRAGPSRTCTIFSPLPMPPRMAAEAISMALEDAGIERSELDGLVTYTLDHNPESEVARMMGGAVIGEGTRQAAREMLGPRAGGGNAKKAKKRS